MAALIKLLRNTLLLLCICICTSYSSTNAKPEILLIGSTPGGELVKTILSIPAEEKIDFIRWNLILNENNSFVLDINYGESQPNTLDFKGGGKKATIKGTFSVSESSNFKAVYHLKSTALSTEILIVKLNENIFHLLTSQHQMMVGNGGWGYSLNRKEPIPNDEISISSKITDGKSLQFVYDGRTPCQEIGNEHPEMKVIPSCFKIKWRLILNRDAVTYKPTTCSIRNIVNNQPRDILGKWEIIKGTETNPNAIIYKIIVNNLSEPILLFAADDNVLFFIDKNKNPMIGNKDFGFTLNKKSQ